MPALGIRTILPFAALPMLVSTLLFYRPGNVGIWMQALFEWLHVPVFGLISLSLLALTPVSWSDGRRFAAAMVGSLVLAASTEALQIPLGRSASLKDLVSDAQGAISFLMFAFAIRRSRPVAVLVSILSIAILALSALPLASLSDKFVRRNSQFPVIFSGDIESERTFVMGRNVRMDTRWEHSTDRPYTNVVFLAGKSPAIDIRNLVPDWSDYAFLSLDIEIEGEKDLAFTLRIHDKAHRRGEQPHNDRYNRRFAVPPGRHNLRIALQDVENAPLGRRMDMTEIEAIVVFSGKYDEARVLNLYEIRLD